MGCGCDGFVDDKGVWLWFWVPLVGKHRQLSTASNALSVSMRSRRISDVRAPRWPFDRCSVFFSVLCFCASRAAPRPSRKTGTQKSNGRRKGTADKITDQV